MSLGLLTKGLSSDAVLLCEGLGVVGAVAEEEDQGGGGGHNRSRWQAVRAAALAREEARLARIAKDDETIIALGYLWL